METAFGIILVILFLIIVMRPVLQRWFGPMFQRWAMGKMEDNMRRMAGMPTRKEERKAQKRAARRQKSGAENFRRAAGGRRRGAAPGRAVGSRLQSYAEDVEFTEIRSFSREVNIGVSREDGRDRVVIEEQIEDVEFTEIKSPSSSGK